MNLPFFVETCEIKKCPNLDYLRSYYTALCRCTNPQERGRKFDYLIGNLLITLPQCRTVHVKKVTSVGEFDCISILETEDRLKPKIIIAENKWMSSKAQVSDINEFFGKVRSILGSAIDVECLVFTSYNGFTEDAERRALEISRTEGIYFLLVDGSDIENCINGYKKFEDILRGKIQKLVSKLIS